MWHTHNCTHSDLSRSRSPSRMSCMTRAGRTPHHRVRPRRQRPHLDAPCLACKCPTWHPHPLPLSVSPDARIETADSTIYTTTTAPPIPPVMAPSTRARTTWCTRVSRARAPEGVCWSLTPQGALPDCIRQSHHHQRSCHCYRHAAS